MDGVVIAPSVLSADLADLRVECEKLMGSGADWLHLDVMDGHFVHNITFGPPVVKSLSRHFGGAKFDVHMMVSDPGAWVDAMAEAGAWQTTFHWEALPEGTEQAIALANRCKAKGMKAGLSVKPKTPLSDALPALKSGAFDTLLVMTVEPGFGGQRFMPECLDKVREARQLCPAALNIQVDGGINLETGKAAAEAGANAFVAGTFIVSAKDTKETIRNLRDAVTL